MKEESVFEKIRNKLATISFCLEAVKHDMEEADESSLISRSIRNMEDITILLKQAENQCKCTNSG